VGRCFTIPQELNQLFYLNQRQCYNILFKASWECVKQASLNTEFLGAETGALSVLHTWGQSLSYHPHIHMIVPAGGLDEDGIEWCSSHGKFFLPVKALSSMFRGIVCRMLKEGIELKQIDIPSKITSFETLKDKLYEKNWNVYSKKSFGGVDGVLQYLGRYTHRVAISNSRIKSADSKGVDFYWKDYRNKNRIKLMRLDTAEFIRRFLMHVLPSGFYKIRYYGERLSDPVPT